MANSRKRPSASELDAARAAAADASAQAAGQTGTHLAADADADADAIRQAVSQALAVIRPDRTLAIAFSGGLDSTVLLDAFVHAAGPGRCLALHIHHGLSPHADHWQDHCQFQSTRRSVRFFSAHVDLSPYRGLGVEAAARLARYAALRDLAHLHGADVLVLGQHADDQAETVLLQMLRGAGVAGLAAMPAVRDIDVETVLRDEKFSAHALPLIRPLLPMRRVQLEAYAFAQQLDWIEDESNQDVRFVRNALRRDVLPVIARYFPAYRDTLQRVARHAASAQRLFDDLAQLDFERCRSLGDGDRIQAPSATRSISLSRTAIQSLSVERLGNLLRFWMRSLGLRAASASRLDEMVVQLHGARRRDASVRMRHREQSSFGRLSIQHDGWILHGYRDDVYWSAKPASVTSTLATVVPPPDQACEAGEANPGCVHHNRPAGNPPCDNEADAAQSPTMVSYAGEGAWALAAWKGTLLVSTLSAGPSDACAIGIATISPGEASAKAKHVPVVPGSDALSLAHNTARMHLIVPSKWLATGTLSVRKRQGGERLSLGVGRPSRPLKHLFQEAGVPAWQREVPLFYLNDALIFVPYLGGSLRALAGDVAQGHTHIDEATPSDDGQTLLEWRPW